MSEKKKRRRRTAAEKLRVVLSGLDGSVEVSELCRREGINPTQYYGWKKQLVTSAAKVFADGRESKPSAKEQRMESELRRAKDVIAEITAENLDLKKGSRIRGPRPIAGGVAARSACCGLPDEASQRLAGAADFAATGRLTGELLPVARRSVASEVARGIAGAAGAGVRSDGRGEARGAKLCVKTSRHPP